MFIDAMIAFVIAFVLVFGSWLVYSAVYDMLVKIARAMHGPEVLTKRFDDREAP